MTLKVTATMVAMEKFIKIVKFYGGVAAPINSGSRRILNSSYLLKILGTFQSDNDEKNLCPRELEKRPICAGVSGAGVSGAGVSGEAHHSWREAAAQRVTHIDEVQNP